MRKFLLNTLFFSLLILLSLAVGEFLIRSIDNPYMAKDRAIRNHGKEFETIFLGNSHTFYGINTNEWPEKALNGGNVSQPIAYDLRLLEHYIDSLPNLKNIVMQISLTSLFDKDMEDTEEWWRCINYQLYNHLGVHPGLSRYSFEISHFPVYAEKVKTLLHISSPKLISDSLGNGLGYDGPLSDKELEESGKRNSKGHKKSSNINNLPQNLSYLEKIAQICRERNIKLYFFTQPHYRSYRENADSEYINRMEREINKFASSHNAKYFNLFSDPRFLKEDFFDGDHLNGPSGAKKLTRILIDSIYSSK